jgi:hypothetical protein
VVVMPGELHQARWRLRRMQGARNCFWGYAAEGLVRLCVALRLCAAGPLCVVLRPVSLLDASD